MSVYKIADLNIEINSKFKYTQDFCSEYICNDVQPEIDFSVSAKPEDYEKDKSVLTDYPEAYIESVSIYRQIARRILDYNGIVMHACVVEIDGISYAFSAKSGTGKSTHAALWLKNFGKRARIINGDKPILRYLDNELYVYGTPWCGKERQHTNTRSPLRAVCFIERDSQNSIRKIDNKEAIKRIFTQLLLPEDASQAQYFFDFLDIMFKKLDFYLLKCNMDISAAQVAFDGMSKDGKC